MAEEHFDTLLRKIPRIAEATNLFKSEEVQMAAFSALIGLATSDVSWPPAETPKQRAPESQTSKQATGATAESAQKTRKKVADSRGSWVFKKDIDLRPTGKRAFLDFVAEKQPKTNEDKYVVAVYYLSEILERPLVTIDEIGSIFRLTPIWREPKALDAGLRMASNRQGTLDTSDRNNVFLTPHGRNYVEHDLPVPEGKK